MTHTAIDVAVALQGDRHGLANTLAVKK